MQIYKYVIKISKFANMKKNTSLFLLVLTIFSACETEFNVNSDWKEVTVVYGLLDQSQDKQYIRINRAFLGEEDAFVMASVADSVNYNPNNLEVLFENKFRRSILKGNLGKRIHMLFLLKFIHSGIIFFPLFSQ